MVLGERFLIILLSAKGGRSSICIVNKVRKCILQNSSRWALSHERRREWEDRVSERRENARGMERIYYKVLVARKVCGKRDSRIFFHIFDSFLFSLRNNFVERKFSLVSINFRFKIIVIKYQRKENLFYRHYLEFRHLIKPGWLYLKVSFSYKSSLIVKISNKLNRMYYSQRILFSIGIQFRASESFQMDTHSLLFRKRMGIYI